MLTRNLRVWPIRDDDVSRATLGASSETFRDLCLDFPPKLVRWKFAVEEGCKRGVTHGSGRKPRVLMSAMGGMQMLARECFAKLGDGIFAEPNLKDESDLFLSSAQEISR